MQFNFSLKLILNNRKVRSLSKILQINHMLIQNCRNQNCRGAIPWSIYRGMPLLRVAVASQLARSTHRACWQSMTRQSGIISQCNISPQTENACSCFMLLPSQTSRPAERPELWRPGWHKWVKQGCNCKFLWLCSSNNMPNVQAHALNIENDIDQI